MRVMTRLIPILVLIGILGAPAFAGQRVILKADDMPNGPLITPGWKHYLNYLDAHNIWSTAGVIGYLFEDLSSADIAYLATRDKVEYYNHGWSSGTNEFENGDASLQYQSLRQTHDIVVALLGRAMSGFAAPGNHHDCATIDAVLAMGYEWWFFPKWLSYGCAYPSGVAEIPRAGGEIEAGAGNPNYASFLASYDPNVPVATFQVHPGIWDAADQTQFEMIVDYLVDLGVEFTTPRRILDAAFRFTKKPHAQWLQVGDPLLLTVECAGGVAPLSYQWIKDDDEIDEATEPSYHVDSVTHDHEGWYSCRVTDASKTLYETDPVLIEVFEEGQMPAAGMLAIVVMTFAYAAWGVRRIARKR